MRGQKFKDHVNVSDGVAPGLTIAEWLSTQLCNLFPICLDLTTNPVSEFWTKHDCAVHANSICMEATGIKPAEVGTTKELYIAVPTSVSRQ